MATVFEGMKKLWEIISLSLRVRRGTRRKERVVANRAREREYKLLILNRFVFDPLILSLLKLVAPQRGEKGLSF